MGYLMSLSRYLDPTTRVLFHGVSVSQTLNNSLTGYPTASLPGSDSLTHSLTS